MRAARILRALPQASRYLEPGAPTGLTGLLTHSAPRSSLIYIYYNTLQKLKQLPESSVYRQSTEALTKHRLSVVEAVKPEGLEGWRERVRKTVEEHPQAFQAVASQADPEDINFVARQVQLGSTADLTESPETAKPRNAEEKARYIHEVMVENQRIEDEIANIEPEPQLTAEQINEVESKIGAGLIEEIIQVAQGESQLVNTMIHSKAWEELEEKPAEGQWVYHERDTHTPTTQAP